MEGKQSVVAVGVGMRVRVGVVSRRRTQNATSPERVLERTEVN